MISYDELFFTENIINVNKIVEKIIFSMCIVPIAFYSVSATGMWIVQNSFSIILFTYSIISSALVFFLNKYRKTQIISMYLGMLIVTLFVYLLGSTGIINLSVSLGLVPFISCLYYNKLLTRVTSIVSVISVIISFYFRSFDILQNYTFSIAYYTQNGWFISHTIGFLIESIFVFLVAFAISKRTNKTLHNLMDSMNARDKAYKELERKNADLHRTQENVIKFVAEVLGSHDLFTGRHVLHTQKYVGIIARELRTLGFYTDILTDDVIKLFETAAFLHDIGKIHIPEGVLNKTGIFTDEERELMKIHPNEGKKLLCFLPSIEGGEFNKIAEDMALYHHEKWDGSGYPNKIKGNDIPLCARIMAAADVLDALISQRLYKSPMFFDDAMMIFTESSGKHFEPCIVDAVLSCKDKLIKEDLNFKKIEGETNSKELKWWKDYHDKLNAISKN